jgi:hypothetical protein
MTENQKKLVELDKKKEEIKKFYEELKLTTEAVSKEVGIDGYFQDDEGIVYKVVIPEGKFVHFENIATFALGAQAKNEATSQCRKPKKRDLSSLSDNELEHRYRIAHEALHGHYNATVKGFSFSRA